MVSDYLEIISDLQAELDRRQRIEDKAIELMEQGKYEEANELLKTMREENQER